MVPTTGSITPPPKACKGQRRKKAADSTVAIRRREGLVYIVQNDPLITGFPTPDGAAWLADFLR